VLKTIEIHQWILNKMTWSILPPLWDPVERIMGALWLRAEALTIKSCKELSSNMDMWSIGLRYTKWD
jgi:hypothetical protein